MKKVRLRNCGTLEFIKHCIAFLFRKNKGPKADEKSVLYGKSKDQCFDLWYGDMSNEINGAPVLVFFHGGGFIKGSRFYSKMLRLAHNEGVTVVAAGYRLSACKSYTIEDSIEDSALLIAFLREHFDKYKIDPNRIAVCGNSAGGTIALCLAVRPNIVEGFSNRVVCATSHNAPTLLDPEVFQKLMGLSSIEPFWYLWSKLFNAETQEELKTDRVQSMIKRTSPELFLSNDSAPIYMNYETAPPAGGKHSYDDPLVNILHSARFGERFIEKANQVGALCQFSHPERCEQESQIDFILEHLRVNKK